MESSSTRCPTCSTDTAAVDVCYLALTACDHTWWREGSEYMLVTPHDRETARARCAEIINARRAKSK